jgi:hypothetical protein
LEEEEGEGVEEAEEEAILIFWEYWWWNNNNNNKNMIYLWIFLIVWINIIRDMSGVQYRGCGPKV